MTTNHIQSMSLIFNMYRLDVIWVSRGWGASITTYNTITAMSKCNSNHQPLWIALDLTTKYVITYSRDEFLRQSTAYTNLYSRCHVNAVTTTTCPPTIDEVDWTCPCHGLGVHEWVGLTFRASRWVEIEFLCRKRKNTITSQLPYPATQKSHWESTLRCTPEFTWHLEYKFV